MTLEYNIVGSGPIKVVWAHSWLAGQAAYALMLPFLDTEQFTWAFPDFRGYGRSQEIAGDFSASEMGRDLLGVADALDWGQFHLVGHSMGGQAAQWVSGQAAARDRLASLVLLCAVPSRGFPLDAETSSLFEAATESLEARATVISGVTAGRLGAGFVRHVNEWSRATTGPGTLRAYLKTWTQDDVSAEVQGYEGPVLVLTGRYDPVLPAAVAEEQIVPQYTAVRSIVLDGTAHLPPMETPAHTVTVITEHCLSLTERPGR
jgi:esterase